MEQFIALLVDNFDLVLSVIIGFLCFFVAWFRTGSLKKAIKQLKEYEDMIKYRTAEQAQEENRVGQKFSNTVTDYILDPATNELEVSPVPKDVQAQIESYKDVALDRTLERFLPDQVVDDNDHIADYTQKVQDLAVIADAMDLAEEYRERYNLDPNMSVSDIYKFVNQKSYELKKTLLNQNKPSEDNDNGKSKTQETK